MKPTRVYVKLIFFQHFEIRYKEISTVGWYTYNEYNFTYYNKSKQALKLSQLRYPHENHNDDESSDSSHQMVFVIGISLTACASIFCLGVYLIQRYYKSRNLTQDDVNSFFNGILDNKTDQSDRSRYEVPKEKFVMETDTSLGSGEF